MSLNKFIDRQRSKLGRDRDRSRPRAANNLHGAYLHGFFSDQDDLADLPRDDIQRAKLQQQVRDVKANLVKRNIIQFSDDDIVYALRLPFTSASSTKAVTLLALIHDSETLIVRDYDESVQLLGAVNRSGISCYLDSVLFAMFAHLKSFELMLHTKFDDRNRNHLAALLRLWVNIVRSGLLVTSDITREIQEALGRCGWKDAAERRQQDALEAFAFILEQLGFPDLHLKMDIFHSGKEDEEDDHKIVHERVLVMPLPEARDDSSPIKLEDCFELALIARIDVRRKYDQERRATFSSIRSPQHIDFSKNNAVQVDLIEVAPDTPVSEANGRGSLPPSGQRTPPPSYRSSSFIQEREIPENEKAIEAGFDSETPIGSGRGRAHSLRKEVLMPAWQMYSLIPFHTDGEPKSDTEVVEHLRENRPTFCIALKRYTFGSNGQAIRRDDYVDIPLDMALPHFIQDNTSNDSHHLFENFKISLQSLVCHRGTHVESGHYVSIARVQRGDGMSKWLLFDDLAETRVRQVDIQKALKDEMPYLLYYQVEPINENWRIRETASANISEAGESLPPTTAASIVESDAASENPSLPKQSLERTPSLPSAPRGRTSTSRERPPSSTATELSYLAADKTYAGKETEASIAAPTPVPSATYPADTNTRTSPEAHSEPTKSAPVSRHGSVLHRTRPKARSRGTSVEPPPSNPTPAAVIAALSAAPRTSSSRTRNRLSGLFSSAAAINAFRTEGPKHSGVEGTPASAPLPYEEGANKLSKLPPGLPVEKSDPSKPPPQEGASVTSLRPRAREVPEKSSTEYKHESAAVAANAAGSMEPARLHRKEREKERARNRLSSHHGALSKRERETERPDRECLVM